MKKQRKIILFIATSIDGYIAKENGAVNWLNDVQGVGDNGYGEFYQTIDSILMGKTTYDHLLTLVEEFPHYDKKCFIFSNLPHPSDKSVEFVSGDVVNFTKHLQQQDGLDIWLVGGAGLLDQFLKENLVDEFIITVAPIMLGSGIPLFKHNNPETKLSLKESRCFGEFVQLHYVTQ